MPIPLTPSPQAVSVALIVAAAYVTYIVIMSLDKGYRMSVAARSETTVILQLVSNATLSVALVLAMFLIPLKMGNSLNSMDLAGWGVAALAVGYSGVFLFTTVTSYVEYTKLRKSEMEAFNRAATATGAANMRQALAALKIDAAVIGSIVPATGLVSSIELLRNAAALRSGVLAKTSGELGKLANAYPDAMITIMQVGWLEDTAPSAGKILYSSSSPANSTLTVSSSAIAMIKMYAAAAKIQAPSFSDNTTTSGQMDAFFAAIMQHYIKPGATPLTSDPAEAMALTAILSGVSYSFMSADDATVRNVLRGAGYTVPAGPIPSDLINGASLEGKLTDAQEVTLASIYAMYFPKSSALEQQYSTAMEKIFTAPMQQTAQANVFTASPNTSSSWARAAATITVSASVVNAINTYAAAAKIMAPTFINNTTTFGEMDSFMEAFMQYYMRPGATPLTSDPNEKSAFGDIYGDMQVSLVSSDDATVRSVLRSAGYTVPDGPITSTLLNKAQSENRLSAAQVTTITDTMTLYFPKTFAIIEQYMNALPQIFK